MLIKKKTYLFIVRSTQSSLMWMNFGLWIYFFHRLTRRYEIDFRSQRTWERLIRWLSFACFMYFFQCLIGTPPVSVSICHFVSWNCQISNCTYNVARKHFSQHCLAFRVNMLVFLDELASVRIKCLTELLEYSHTQTHSPIAWCNN